MIAPDTDRGETISARLKGAAPLVLVLLAVVLGSLWATYRWSEHYFLSEITERGRDSLNLYAENMRGWLGRFRALPRIYAHNPNVSALLGKPGDQRLIDTVNAFLSQWNLATGAAETYLLDDRGTAIAASNWADEVTFVGKNYSYRPYYRQALQGSLGRFFALGTSSHKRGYYFSYPVRSGAKVIGVMVVKVGVGEIERKMQTSPDELFVTSPEGVILLAGHEEWRLTTLAPLDEAARARIEKNRQFDLEELASVGPFGSELRDGDGQLVRAGLNPSEARSQEFLHLSLPMKAEDWTLHILINTRFARNQTLTALFLAASLLFAIGLIAILIWQRRRRLVDLLSERERARAMLERTVRARTADLSASNLQLEEEVSERKAAEAELRLAQNELVQAGKLAALGQMSAALSHEFNQPLAAIRTYAENAAVFLERAREAEVRGNLAHIVALTERMAELSKHLRSFARKPQDSARPVSLSIALSETLDLLRGRLEAASIVPRIDAVEDGLWVLGGHIRLQQVIMNLIVNALDAMREVADPRLVVTVEQAAETVRLIVEDNGPGLPADHREQIFDPFFTTKEVGAGLGLGLSISFNILKDFGGSITAENRKEGGARFVLRLQAAVPPAADAGDKEAAE